GILIAPYAPWAAHGVFQRVNLVAHAYGILIFAVPNVLFIGAIVFAVGALTRSTAAASVTAICVLTGYFIAMAHASDLKNESIAALIEPFAASAFGMLTTYWTTTDKNHLLVWLRCTLLWNRLIWATVSCSIFGLV